MRSQACGVRKGCILYISTRKSYKLASVSIGRYDSFRGMVYF